MSKIQYAFRIVHIDNIPDILKYGLVHRDSPNASKHYVPIGDPTVINTRTKKKLPNGSYLSDYIPFYFGPRSPMLYNIQHGYGFVDKQNPQDIVYCVLVLQTIIESDINCIFSDGHALDSASSFYEKEQLNQLKDIVSYDDVYSKFWFNKDILDDRKRRKEAELLIKGDVPSQYIKGYVVFNQEAYNKMLSYGVPEEKICLKKEFYY